MLKIINHLVAFWTINWSLESGIRGTTQGRWTNLNPQQVYHRHNQHPRFQHLLDFLFWDLECIRFSIYSMSATAHFDLTKIGISGPWGVCRTVYTWSHQSELIAANLSTSDWLSDDHLFISRCVLFIEFNKIVIWNYNCSNPFFSNRWVTFFSFEMELTVRNVNFSPKKWVRSIKWVMF